MLIDSCEVGGTFWSSEQSDLQLRVEDKSRFTKHTKSNEDTNLNHNSTKLDCSVCNGVEGVAIVCVGV